MEGLQYLNKTATAKTGAYPRTEHGKGRVIAYCGAPMVCLLQEDGSTFWWRVDLCEFEQPLAPLASEDRPLSE